MKFNELYNNIFMEKTALAEEDSSVDIASPEDFNDVEPMPLPEPTELATQEPDAQSATKSDTSASGSTIHNYINKLDTYADELNNLEADSLLTFVTKLDVPGTAFEGISRTKADILRAAEVLRTTSEQLKSFLIGATAQQNR